MEEWHVWRAAVEAQRAGGQAVIRCVECTKMGSIRYTRMSRARLVSFRVEGVAQTGHAANLRHRGRYTFATGPCNLRRRVQKLQPGYGGDGWRVSVARQRNDILSDFEYFIFIIIIWFWWTISAWPWARVACCSDNPK